MQNEFFSKETDYVRYLKKFTAIAISVIFYGRNFFDEDSFFLFNYQTIKLRILSKKSKSGNVQKVIEYIKGCFDALDRGYLKTLSLNIFEKTQDGFSSSPIETYQFNFMNTTRRNKTNKKIQLQVSSILKNLFKNLQTLKMLSTNKSYFALFKLSYHDDLTPVEYEPPGFQSATESNLGQMNNSVDIQCGQIDDSFNLIIKLNKI